MENLPKAGLTGFLPTLWFSFFSSYCFTHSIQQTRTDCFQYTGLGAQHSEWEEREEEGFWGDDIVWWAFGGGHLSTIRNDMQILFEYMGVYNFSETFWGDSKRIFFFLRMKSIINWARSKQNLYKEKHRILLKNQKSGLEEMEKRTMILG